MRLVYSICAVLAFGAWSAGAQTPPADARAYLVFFRGSAIGREDITVRTDGGDFVISGTGRLSPPLDILTKRAEVRYGADWSPRSMEFEGVANLREQLVKISFANGEAHVDATVGGKPMSKVD